MEKTIKINIAGSIFQIEEEAFELLRDYLQQINIRLKDLAGGNEMIDDIEARIAEIFQSSPSWKTGVISIDDVKEMMSTMGSPDEIAGDMDREEFTYEKRGRSKRLYRDSDGSIIGGVCNGLGAYLRIDPVWIRILFILFTIVYLSGLFVYIILWIALPRATSVWQKRELHEEPPPVKDLGNNFKSEVSSAANNVKSSASQGAEKVGSAFNEVFRAFGKFFVILFRIILAIVGVSFIVAGFSALLSYVIMVFFQSPIIMGRFFDAGMFNVQDFLSTLAGPALAPWIIILSSLVVMLPLIGMIYWGIRMVFQFRARDLVLNISMIIIWIVSCTALSLLLFSEGISFSHSERVYEDIELQEDINLNIQLGNNIGSIEYDKTLSVPSNNIKYYLDQEGNKLYGTPEIQIYHTDEEPHIKITKYSSGRTSGHARQQADMLEFYYSLEGDTLFVDEFYTIPDGTMWPGVKIKIRIFLNEGSIVFIDEDIENLFRDYQGNGIYSYELGEKSWEVTERGLKKH